MKKIFVGFLSLSIIVLFSVLAWAWWHGGRWGGTVAAAAGLRPLRTPRAAARRTAGGGTSHTNAYGGSTSHAYGEGTSHTNIYGGSATHTEGGGWSKTGAYGGTAYGDAHYGGAYYGGGGYAGYHPPPWLITTGPGATTAEAGRQRAQQQQVLRSGRSPARRLLPVPTLPVSRRAAPPPPPMRWARSMRRCLPAA